ncbi:MAG: hypothetical protein C4291_06845 [Candidatus Dadabacteria bacterium]
MRRIITFVAVLGFISTASIGLAATKMGSKETVWVSGKVTAIENGILSLRESNGQTFKVAAKSDKLKGIHVGERIAVEDINGWAVSINKEAGKRTAKSHTGLAHKQG